MTNTWGHSETIGREWSTMFAHEHDIKPQPQRIAYVCSYVGSPYFSRMSIFIAATAASEREFCFTLNSGRTPGGDQQSALCHKWTSHYIIRSPCRRL